jgi:hypothetical protein
MVRLAPDTQYRVSKRGLVLAGAGGDTVLFDHPPRGDSSGAARRRPRANNPEVMSEHKTDTKQYNLAHPQVTPQQSSRDGTRGEHD